MKYEKVPFRIEKQFRLEGFDYSQNGYYFVTICTHNKEKYFGEIKNDIVKLNQIGKIAFQNWVNILNHFSNILLDEYIIMPDHIHGLLVVKNNDKNTINDCRNMPWHVPTEEDKFNKFSKSVSDSISIVINHFKGSVKRQCNLMNYKFCWQPRFHDRIIRSEKEYFAIKQYIKDNPRN